MKKKLLSVVLVLIFVAMFSITALAVETDVGVQPGEKMPDFTVSLTDGSSATLSEVLKEKDLVVLNIFASYCGPCEREFPEMEKVYQEYKDRMEIIAVSGYSEDTMEIIADYKESHGLTFSVGLTGDALDFLTIPGYPTTFFIDKNGMLGFVKIGAFESKKQFKDKVEVYLDENYNGTPLGTQKPSVPTVYIVVGAYLVLSCILMVIARWRMFKKAGTRGWFSLIPYFNVYEEYAICWKGWIGITGALLVLAGFSMLFLAPPDFAEVALVIFGVGIVLGLPQSILLARAFGLHWAIGILMFIPGFREIIRLIIGFAPIKYRLSGRKAGKEQTAEQTGEQTGEQTEA